WRHPLRLVHRGSGSKMEMCKRYDRRRSRLYVRTSGRGSSPDHDKGFNSESNGKLCGLFDGGCHDWQWLHPHLQFKGTVKRQIVSSTILLPQLEAASFSMLPLRSHT